jgi:cytochrome c peroxidase
MFSSAIRSSLRSSSRLTARSAAQSRVSAFRTPGFRKYSTEAPKSSSNILLWSGLGVAAAGGVAWYIYGSDADVKVAETALKSGVQSAKVAANFVPSKGDYQKVRVPRGKLTSSRVRLTFYVNYLQVYNKIAELLDDASDAGYDDGSYGPVILRLAWHASGTYDKETGTGGR